MTESNSLITPDVRILLDGKRKILSEEKKRLQEKFDEMRERNNAVNNALNAISAIEEGDRSFRLAIVALGREDST